MIDKKPKYKLTDFDYSLPDKHIAQYPAEKRDQSKLLVLNREDESIEHTTFANIDKYLRKNDLLILNRTKVFPARLYGNKEKTGARIEVFLLRELNAESRLWDVIVDPARKIRIGNKLYFENDLVAEVIDNTTSRGRTIRFVFEGENEELIADFKGEEAVFELDVSGRIYYTRDNHLALKILTAPGMNWSGEGISGGVVVISIPAEEHISIDQEYKNN